MEEYVPVMNPMINVNANGRITYPPKVKSASRTKTAVPEVMMVRLKVSLMLRFMTTAKDSRRNLRIFSRMRSETIIVSCTEYPTTVRMAAKTDRSKGSCEITRAPVTTKTS